jgi:hypothetical protein
MDCCAYSTIAQLISSDIDEAILAPIFSPTVLYDPVVTGISNQQYGMVDGSVCRALVNS